MSILLVHSLENIQYGSKYLVATPFHLLIKISYSIKNFQKIYVWIYFVFLLRNNIIPSAFMAWSKIMCPGIRQKTAIYETNSQAIREPMPTPSFVPSVVLRGPTSITDQSIFFSLFLWLTSWTSNEILLGQLRYLYGAMGAANLDQSWSAKTV